MTNTPGEGQTPQEPHEEQTPTQGQGEPGYGEQQARQPGYGQPSGYGEQQPGYGQGYPAQAPTGYAPDHPQATTSLVLGILGVVLCQLVAPFAWVIGKRTVNEIDASQGQLGGRGAANAGYVLGIVGTIILGASILFMILLFGIIGIGALSQY